MLAAFKLLPFLVLLLISFTQKSFAIEDPRLFPNNKFGVHILFPSEISDAAKLVNSNGGDWGYITIPIQAGDKDLAKWQQFMDSAKQNHVIPIIRLATEGDYFKSGVWRKATFTDVLDFANFLNSLDWPTLNRYIVVFNEPNRSDEWGGLMDASEYANILSYAVDVFKSKHSDFFIISAGFDNAAADTEEASINQYSFMQKMHSAVPKVFNKIDAIASHSYPNPGFSQPPWVITKRSIASFIHEKRLADLLGDKNLPVFITETGWSKDMVSQTQIASYFTDAFESVWNSDDIVSVTPFLLQAGAGPFTQFSLINENGTQNEVYKTLTVISKIKGNPKIPEVETVNDYALKNVDLPPRNFLSSNKDIESRKKETALKSKIDTATEFAKWLLRI